MSFATDEEIRIAHDILLEGKDPFDKARISIIKEDSSCYVQACPGSGKTTVLLAKLIILANRMPLPEGKGVCVLTHTNVAIDEIKAKVGPQADVLFRYPNFFGTIQSFLHKYVTAAALHYFYGSQISYVDDDMAKAVLFKKYCNLDWRNKLKGFIYCNAISREHVVLEDEINRWGGIEAMLAAKVIKKKGPRSSKYIFQFKDYDFANVPVAVQRLIHKKNKSIIYNEEKRIIINSKVDWLNNKVFFDQKQIGVASGAGSEYVKIKEELFKEGLLSFEDAYDLAFRYIREKELDFSRLSDKRFKYLFIDEVQDCNKKQVDLIRQLFADDKVVVQRFGDYCQAIFDEEEDNGADNDRLKGDHVLYIHDSNRFGEMIARPLRSLCMEDNSQLEGNEDVPSVKPVIISYEDPLAVIPKYIELLHTSLIPEKNNISVYEIANREKGKDPLHRINVKACGWVGKKGANQKKVYIESYYPAFEKASTKARTEGERFDVFLHKTPNASVKDHASSIIQGILKYLDLCDVKNGNRRYTRTALLNYLSSDNEGKREDFLSRVMRWAMLEAGGGKTGDDAFLDLETIHHYLTMTLLPLFKKEETAEANAFIFAPSDDASSGLNNEDGNIFHGEGIDLEVATVHSVKGETHASTLYLETYYDKYHESERIGDQFKGIAYSGDDANVLRSLKVAYVGMSRPRYLLCVAIQKDRFEQIDCVELREIWKVVEA